MQDEVGKCKDRTREVTERFLRVLSFVPKDRLSWRPTPTAKSAIEIAAHCAGFGGGFARVIKAGAFPASVDDFLGPIHACIASITTLEQVETELRSALAETIAALDEVKPEQIDLLIDTPQGKTPFLFFMNIPANHLYGHTYQIDYLQTCWGDEEVHL